MEQQLVMPGEKVGVEEEFIPSENTYVDGDGIIRAAIVGSAVVREGKVSVINQKHDVKRIKRGMLVLGKVSDDLRSVMFVKLDNVKINGLEFLALKDGKIVNSARRPMGGGRDFGSREMREERTAKPCRVGDVIIARIIYEDPEIFTLGFNDPECGVIYAECEMCSEHLEPDQKMQAVLACPACKHREQRKISSLYSKPESIRKLFIQ